MVAEKTGAKRLDLRFARALAEIFGPKMAGKLITFLARARLMRAQLKTYYILSTQPIIVYIGNVMRHTFEIAELLKHRRVHFIKNSYHTFERLDRLTHLVAEVREFRRLYPQHRLTFICPTEHERNLFESVGLVPCHFINKNAFVDESQYGILGIEKEFSAVHNGQMKPYKRHELASEISDLAVITYLRPNASDPEGCREYSERIRRVLSHATWLNEGKNTIPPGEISRSLNRARVGLCLSKEEGPMAASIEYLLCGLPIVSTRSLGGRDVFFDERYVRIVDDSPHAVARGVDDLVGLDLEPEFVRAETLKKMRVHRDRFVALVDSVRSAAGVASSYELEFRESFSNKMRLSAPFPGAFLTHVATGMPVSLCRQMAAIQNS